MTGSLIITFTENILGAGGSYYKVLVNGQPRDLHYSNTKNLYSTNLEVGDVVEYYVVGVGGKRLGFFRKDYTTDAEGDNMGIYENEVAGLITTSSSDSVPVYTFTATTVSNAYDFEYRIDQFNYEILVELEYNYSAPETNNRTINLIFNKDGNSSSMIFNPGEEDLTSGRFTRYITYDYDQITGLTSMNFSRSICQETLKEKSDLRVSKIYLNDVQIGTPISGTTEIVYPRCDAGVDTFLGQVLTSSTSIPIYSHIKFVIDEEFILGPLPILIVNYHFRGNYWEPQSSTGNTQTNNLTLLWTGGTGGQDFETELLSDYPTTGDYQFISGQTILDVSMFNITDYYGFRLQNRKCSDKSTNGDSIWRSQERLEMRDMYPDGDPCNVQTNIENYPQSVSDCDDGFTTYLTEKEYMRTNFPGGSGCNYIKQLTWGDEIIIEMDQDWCPSDFGTLNYEKVYNLTASTDATYSVRITNTPNGPGRPFINPCDNSYFPTLSGTITGTGGTINAFSEITGVAALQADVSHTMFTSVTPTVSRGFTATTERNPGTNIKLYINDVLQNTYTPIGPNPILVGDVSNNDTVKLEFNDSLDILYTNGFYNFKYVWNNSADNSFNITGGTGLNYSSTPINPFSVSLTGNSGSYETGYLEGPPSMPRPFSPSSSIFRCNNNVNDNIVTRTWNVYFDEVLQPEYTFVYTGLTNPFVEQCPIVRNAVLSGSWIDASAGKYVTLECIDLFVGPTPTPTPTPTATPVPPTPTPAPIDIIPVYVGNNLPSGQTKTINVDYSLDGGTTWTNWITRTTSVANPSLTGSTVQFTEGTISQLRIRRSICTTGGSVRTSDDRFGRVADQTNLTISGTASSTANQTITSCPTTTSSTLSTFPSFSITNGNTYTVTYNDTYTF